MASVLLNFKFLLCFSAVNFFHVTNADFDCSNSENTLNFDSSDQPLFLTPYIENKDIETGRSLSRVGPLPNSPNVPSYSGFFTVNKEYNSNLFFWFFPALNKDVNAPFILWLQGGPGGSGLAGMFNEIGPYILHSKSTAGLRNHTWAKEFHVLYVDNPVGTGFSFTENEKGYATNQDQITENLYKFLKQFFEMYNEYRHNDFYIFGESYAGKYGPYLAYKIHMDGTPAEINLKGISIGNGFIDVHILKNFDKYLFQLGIVDNKQESVIKDTFDSMEHHLQKEEYIQAVRDLNKIFHFLKDPDVATTSFLTEFSGYEDFYFNFLQTQIPEDYNFYLEYITSPMARKAIHVGNKPFHGDTTTVKHNLKVDIVKSSSRDKIVFLLDHYKFLFYNGQLDISFPYVTNEDNLLLNITWKHSDEYRNADRKIWRLDNEKKDVAGYVRSADNLFGVLVRNAGHIVPHDQPVFALDLITRFIKNIPYA